MMTRPGTALFLGLDHHPDADRQELSRRDWHVFDTSALTGANVDAAFTWLAIAMSNGA